MQEVDPAYLGESLELQDPYSDLSLFLSKKIKEQMKASGGPKKWSLPIQDKLIEKISAEFQKKFPRYRLGAAPLKRVWDKVSHFSDLFEKQHDALTPEGKLNLHFLVRENLKTVLVQRKKASFHPFLLAQQLALKVGESIATFEGIRPALQNLTGLIWSAQQHLLPFSQHSSLELGVHDRLVIKWMLDCFMESPNLSQNELLERLQGKFKEIQSLKELKQPIPWIPLLAMEWASLLFPSCSFVQTASTQLLQNLRVWIQNHLSNIDLNEAENCIQDIKTAYLLEDPLKSFGIGISLYELEIMGWCYLKEKFPNKESSVRRVVQLLLKEAQSQFIDQPDKHWKAALHCALQFLIKAHEICSTWSKADSSHRLIYWSLQGELILRLLHFPDTPLLHLVQERHQQNHPLNDPLITSHLREQFLSHYQSPLIEPSLVHQKADLLRKYGWYHFASKPEQPTIDCWLLLHELPLRHLAFEKRIGVLISKAQKNLPLLPLDRKSVINLFQN